MKVVPLGEIAEIVSGATPKTGDESLWGGEILWATPADLSKLEGPYIGSTPRTITEAGLKSCAAQVLPAGSVLLSSRAPIGHVAINTQPMATNQGFKSLVPKPDVVDAKYLYHWLRANTSYLQGLGNGATFKEISKAVVSKVEVPLPPLDEQRRIATILDQANDIRTKHRQVVDHLAGLAEAIFLDMFGDPDQALASGSAVRFGEVADLQGGRNLVADDQDSVSEFRVLKISSVTYGDFKPSESKALPAGYVPPADHLVRQGDLLISRANTAELVGAVAYVQDEPSNLVLPDKVWRFVWRNPDSVPLYYRSLFRTPSVRRRISQLASGTGGSMKNISKAKLVELELPAVTPEQQREFARRVGAVPRPAHSEVDELLSSLQSRAFAGQL